MKWLTEGSWNSDKSVERIHAIVGWQRVSGSSLPKCSTDSRAAAGSSGGGIRVHTLVSHLTDTERNLLVITRSPLRCLPPAISRRPLIVILPLAFRLFSSLRGSRTPRCERPTSMYDRNWHMDYTNPRTPHRIGKQGVRRPRLPSWPLRSSRGMTWRRRSLRLGCTCTLWSRLECGSAKARHIRIMPAAH